MAEPNRVIAVDLGGTHIRVAVVCADGLLTNRRSIPTGSVDGPAIVIQRIVDLVDSVASEAGIALEIPVGVSSPGPLDPRTGEVLFTPNLAGWRNVQLGEQLRAGTGRPVSVANDGNCAVLGERRFGVGAGCTDLVYLALGTGVGGGVISGGRLIDGVRGFGAELGHVVVALDGPVCTCGSVGCLESFVGGWAIGRDGALMATTRDGEAIRRAAKGKLITGDVVAKAAATGDAVALAILARAGRALGAAIGAFVNVFNPEIVVIGGGVAAIGESLLDPAWKTVTSHSFHAHRTCVRLELSALGDDTSLYGAGALAMD
ncbi:MAG: ROK family protein [Chloroflexia bacterium]|nr:ROK family protein [Chloroflexia bacterium]